MFFESMECRRLMSVSLEGSSLIVRGTPEGEQLAVSIITTLNKKLKQVQRVQVWEASFTGSRQKTTFFKPSKVGSVKIFGQGGNDVLQMTIPGKTCVLKGGAGDDNLSADSGHDELYGGAGDDSLFGGGGNDRLDGNAGDDGMVGGAGRDVLFGGAGRDSFDGGAGKDLLRGADGARDNGFLGGTGEDTVELDGIDYAPEKDPKKVYRDVEIFR